MNTVKTKDIIKMPEKYPTENSLHTKGQNDMINTISNIDVQTASVDDVTNVIHKTRDGSPYGESAFVEAEAITDKYYLILKKEI